MTGDPRHRNLPEVVLGECVWHTKYGDGKVVDLGALEGAPTARIDFGNAGMHWIVLGGGHLRRESPTQTLEVSLWADATEWIALTFQFGQSGVGLDLRGDRKALDDLLVWLDAITMGVQRCAVEFAAEPSNEPRGDVRRERIEQWLAAG